MAKNMNIPECYLSPQEPTEDLNNDDKNSLGKATLFEYHPDNRGFAEGQINKYVANTGLRYSINATLMTGTNTSTKKQLMDIANRLKGGPYMAHGQDNKLKIHNTKANGKTVASYTYNGGNGELLSMSIDAEFITSVVEAAKTTHIDPKDKSLKTKVVQCLSNNDTSYRNGKIVTTYHPDILKPKNTMQINDATYHKPINKPYYVPAIEDQEMAKRKKLSWKSEEAAYKDISHNFNPTQGELEDYFQQLENDFNKQQHPEKCANADEYRKILKHNNLLKPYVAVRQIQINKVVNPTEYADATGANIRTPDNPVYVANGSTKVPKGWTLSKGSRKRLWNEGYQHLLSNPNITVVKKKGGYKDGEMVEVIETMTKGIPITGVRMLSSGNMVGFGEKEANNIIKNIFDQVKANATVIGRPGLTSSINIEIKGIGSKYSGVWYIKKIKHSIDSQGYTCDIDFRKKNIPISKHIIKTSQNTQKTYANLNKIAKESLKTGSWMFPSLIKMKFEKWRQDTGAPDQNYLIIQNPKKLNQAKVYSAKSDFVSHEYDNVINPNNQVTPIQTIDAKGQLDNDLEE